MVRDGEHVGGEHLDEGEIHAWLDGALPADEAARVVAHLEECVQCAAAVAEARGLIATASRILTALDDVPGGVLPADGVARARGARRRRWSDGGWPVRVAAAIVVAAIGTLAIVRGVDIGTVARVAARDTVSARPPAPPSVVPQPSPAPRVRVASPAKARALQNDSAPSAPSASSAALTATVTTTATVPAIAPASVPEPQMAQLRGTGKMGGRPAGVAVDSIGALAKKEARQPATGAAGCYDVVRPRGPVAAGGVSFPSRLVLDSVPATAGGNAVHVPSTDSVQYVGSTWHPVTIDSIEVDVTGSPAPVTIRTHVDAGGLHGFVETDSFPTLFVAQRCLGDRP